MHLTNSAISVRGGADSFLQSFVSLHQSTFYISQTAPIPQNVAQKTSSALLDRISQDLFVHSDPSWVVLPCWGLSSCFVGIMACWGFQSSSVSAFNLCRGINGTNVGWFPSKWQQKPRLCYVILVLVLNKKHSSLMAAWLKVGITTWHHKGRKWGAEAVRESTPPHVWASSSTWLWSEPPF